MGYTRKTMEVGGSRVESWQVNQGGREKEIKAARRNVQEIRVENYRRRAKKNGGVQIRPESFAPSGYNGR